MKKDDSVTGPTTTPTSKDAGCKATEPAAIAKAAMTSSSITFWFNCVGVETRLLLTSR